MQRIEQLNNDLKKALQNGDSATVSVLRLVKSELKNKEIGNNRQPLTEEEVLQIIRKEVKKRQESILIYQQNKSEELAKKEEEEITILKHYLPTELSDEQLEQKIREILKQQHVSDFATGMKEVMKQLKGQADGKKIKQLVEKVIG